MAGVGAFVEVVGLADVVVVVGGGGLADTVVGGFAEDEAIAAGFAEDGFAKVAPTAGFAEEPAAAALVGFEEALVRGLSITGCGGIGAGLPLGFELEGTGCVLGFSEGDTPFGAGFGVAWDWEYVSRRDWMAAECVLRVSSNSA